MLLEPTDASGEPQRASVVKVSGCMRSMAGAGEFCALRSYLATTAHHGIGAPDALIAAFQGNPWIPETG